METLSPFESHDEASRYHRYRPQYHHIPFGLIHKLAGRKFEMALDVACGTGHSTYALSKIAERTVGCDISDAMLSEAKRASDIEFIKARAEDLPFADHTFDLVNISMGFHWVDQKEFLREAKRVLKPSGILAIDNYGFSGKISPDKAKQQRHEAFLQEFLPRASKQSGLPSETFINLIGLRILHDIPYEHTIRMGAHQFINLLMTWSNYQALDAKQKEITVQKMIEIYESIFEENEFDLHFAGRVTLYEPAH